MLGLRVNPEGSVGQRGDGRWAAAVTDVSIGRSSTGQLWVLPMGMREPVISCYPDIVTRQTTVRLPEELADQAEAVARVRGTSVNSLIVESLTAAINLVRADDDFTARARRLLERDKELLDRLAR